MQQKNIEYKSENNFFFEGFKRKNGKAGTRNYIGLLSTVNCSATVVKKIADNINIILNYKNMRILMVLFA